MILKNTTHIGQLPIGLMQTACHSRESCRASLSPGRLFTTINDCNLALLVVLLLFDDFPYLEMNVVFPATFSVSSIESELAAGETEDEMRCAE
jgi:hypothetical protein